MKQPKKVYIALIALLLTALACGSEVQVNTDGEQPVGQTEATSVPDVGTARSNPAPAGSEVVVDDMGFVVTGSTRPATDQIMAGNQFNSAPEAGQEYVMVNVSITCKKSADEKCTFFTYNLKLLGSSGIQQDPEIMVAGVDGLLDFSISEFFGGATLSGSIPFIIDSTDTDLILVYSPLLGNPFYLAIQ